MAKLSAHGTEVVRLVKEWEVTESESTLINWKRVTVVLMSDRIVLKKEDVRFRSSTFVEGKRHSYGWKKRGKLADHMTTKEFINLYVKMGFKE